MKNTSKAAQAVSSLPDLINSVMTTPYTKNRSGDRRAMRKGGMESRNAQRSVDASFVMQENSNKIKNAAPMYAFTPKNLHNPTPMKMKNRPLNKSSSLRKRHFKSFLSRACIAIEKIADKRKMTAEKSSFWEMAVWIWEEIEKGAL